MISLMPVKTLAALLCIFGEDLTSPRMNWTPLIKDTSKETGKVSGRSADRRGLRIPLGILMKRVSCNSVQSDDEPRSSY